MSPSRSRREPVWITRSLLDGIHHALIEQYGGAHGAISQELIESALARPQNLFHDKPDGDLAALAASLCFGLAKNHGFRDGNKRTAFTASVVFLRLNAKRVTAPEFEVVSAMVFLATDAWTEEQFAEWIRAHLG